MNEILNTILQNTYSTSSLKHRLSILKEYLLQIFFNAEAKLKLQASDSAWLKSLSPDFLKNFNKDNVYKLFENLDHQISSMKILTLYITFETDETSLSQIGEMARKTFTNPSLLLDIKYDPKLIAGAAFSWNGLYRDYSLRAKIEERKLVILESFKKFLR